MSVELGGTAQHCYQEPEECSAQDHLLNKARSLTSTESFRMSQGRAKLTSLLSIQTEKPGVVVHVCNPSCWDAEAGESMHV